jgi:hypothetical protein
VVVPILSKEGRMTTLRPEPLMQEDLLWLGRGGWHLFACGDQVALARTGLDGKVVVLPMEAWGSEKAVEPLWQFADALVALSRAELIRLLVREAACAALKRLNPLVDCSGAEWELTLPDGSLLPLALPAEAAEIRRGWEAQLVPLGPSELPPSLLASRAAALQDPAQIQTIQEEIAVEAWEASTHRGRARCPSAGALLARLAELERKALGRLGRHAETVREMVDRTSGLTAQCPGPIAARGVLAVCATEDGTRIVCAVAKKLPARDPLEAWGKAGGEEERPPQVPGRTGWRRMPMPWA